MPRFEGRFFSIVLVGHQNPQILNHDFLIKNGILQVDKEPLKSLIEKDPTKPFDEFVSVPILASIRYGHVSITVQEDRYQILDNRFMRPADSAIVEITRNYFQKHLRYTPFTAGGMNLNGVIHFSDPEDEMTFDERLGLNRGRLAELMQTENVRAGVAITAAYRNGFVEAQIIKPKDQPSVGLLNLNYEFRFQDIDSFIGNLEDGEVLYLELQRILGELGVAQ